MLLKSVQFLALVLTALALVPAGAHMLALPNKIGLAQDAYLVVQSIYRGWALLGVIWFGALLVTSALAFMLRANSAAFALNVIAILCLTAMIVVFFVWTFPANQATSNWNTMPGNWQVLRREWEYSHVANAVLGFLAFCSTAWSVLTTQNPSNAAGGEAPH